MKRAILALVGIVVGASAHAASFDCSAASTPVENMICQDPDLSALDEQMGSAYKDVRRYRSRIWDVLHAQKNWMTARNRCTDRSCLKQSYQEQLKVLARFREECGSTCDEPPAPACPQCGKWNISDSDWKDWVGDTMVVDGSTLKLPACGIFAYRAAETKTYTEEDRKFHVVSMRVTQGPRVHMPPGCPEKGWTIQMKMDDSELDDGGWSAEISMRDASGGTQRMWAWNPDRTNPQPNTLSEGPVVVFALAHSTKALTAISKRFIEKHGARAKAAFDIDRFATKAMDHCTEIYEADGLHNPSRANNELACASAILDDKAAEFESWQCGNSDGGPNSGAGVCKFPDNSIDDSKEY